MLALVTRAGASITSVKSGGIGGPPFSADVAGFMMTEAPCMGSVEYSC